MDFATPQGCLDKLHAAVLSGEGPVLVVAHNYPDPDSLAAALALSRLLQKWNLPCLIAHGGGLGRAENKAMAGLLEIEMSLFDDLPPPPYRGAVLVDTQPGQGNNSLPETIPVLGVIDHHPAGDEEFDSPVPCNDIRVEYGATSTILLEYLEAGGVALDAQLATALYLGIRTDTDNLERDAGPADVAAWTRLLPLVDLATVRKITHPPLDDEYFSTLRQALDGATRYGEALVANLGPIEIPDLLSAVSDLLIQTKGAAWALAVGWKGSCIYFSLRLRPPRRNAANLLRKTVGERGSGGGHARAAGGQLPVSAGETTQATIEAALYRFLLASGQAEAPRRPLLSARPASKKKK